MEQDLRGNVGNSWQGEGQEEVWRTSDGRTAADLFKIAVDTGDVTGMRTIAAMMAHQANPEASWTIEHEVIRENGRGRREMGNGDIYATNDGGQSWWIFYSAMSDIYYMDENDPVGFYMP